MSDLERDVAIRWCFTHDCKAYRPPVCGMYCWETAVFDYNPDCDFGWKSFDGRLAGIGEDSTPEANVAAVVTGFASVDAVHAFLGSEDLKAIGEDSTSLCSTCGHLHYGTGHVGTVIGEDSTP